MFNKYNWLLVFVASIKVFADFDESPKQCVCSGKSESNNSAAFLFYDELRIIVPKNIVFELQARHANSILNEICEHDGISLDYALLSDGMFALLSIKGNEVEKLFEAQRRIRSLIKNVHEKKDPFGQIIREEKNSSDWNGKINNNLNAKTYFSKNNVPSEGFKTKFKTVPGEHKCWLNPGAFSEQELLRIEAIMHFGFPSCDNLHIYKDFIVSYNRRSRVANWVMEQFGPEPNPWKALRFRNPQILRKNYNDETLGMFKNDPHSHLEPEFAGKNEDYFSARHLYDRGHLAAAGNHKQSMEEYLETFYFTNVAPQNKILNRGKWRLMEKWTRSLVGPNANIYICSGPLYLPTTVHDKNYFVNYHTIGPDLVAVPTHFFKVVLKVETHQKSCNLWALLVPNTAVDENIPNTHFLAPLDLIEHLASFHFFPELDWKRCVINQDIDAIPQSRYYFEHLNLPWYFWRNKKKQRAELHHQLIIEEVSDEFRNSFTI